MTEKESGTMTVVHETKMGNVLAPGRGIHMHPHGLDNRLEASFRRLKVEINTSSSPSYASVGIGRMWSPGRKGKGQGVNRGGGREARERAKFPGF